MNCATSPRAARGVTLRAARPTARRRSLRRLRRPRASALARGRRSTSRAERLHLAVDGGAARVVQDRARLLGARVERLDARAARERRLAARPAAPAHLRRAGARRAGPSPPSSRVRRSTSVKTTRARAAPSPARSSARKILPASSSEDQSATGTRMRSAACQAFWVSASRSLLVSRITRPGHSDWRMMRASARGSSARALSSATSGGDGTKCTPYSPSWIARAEAALRPGVLQVGVARLRRAQREHAVDACADRRARRSAPAGPRAARARRPRGWSPASSCRRRPCSTRRRRRDRRRARAARWGVHPCRREMYRSSRMPP